MSDGHRDIRPHQAVVTRIYTVSSRTIRVTVEFGRQTKYNEACAAYPALSAPEAALRAAGFRPEHTPWTEAKPNISSCWNVSEGISAAGASGSSLSTKSTFPEDGRDAGPFNGPGITNPWQQGLTQRLARLQ